MAFTEEEQKKLDEVQQSIDNSEKIPAGYLTIHLSTKGKLGAPKEFHVRNFKTGELMDLALTDTEDLPLRVVDLLQELIYEPIDVCDIKQFHEKEVEETLFYLYKNFYGAILTDVVWTPTDADKEQIAKESGGNTTDLYLDKIRALEQGEWKPRFDIDLRSVKVYKIPENFKTVASVKKKNGFTCKFGFPRYGDIITLRKYIDEVYKEQDKRFEKIKGMVQYKNDLKDKWEKGETSTDPNRIYIPESELKEYKEYEKEKVYFTIQATIAMNLREIRGKDVSSLPLSKRIPFADDPELDHVTYRKISDAFNSMEVGLVPKLEAVSPITHKPEKINYSFRVFTWLQAIRDNDTDETTISFE